MNSDGVGDEGEVGEGVGGSGVQPRREQEGGRNRGEKGEEGEEVEEEEVEVQRSL